MSIIFCKYIRGHVLPDFSTPISDCSVLCYSRDAVPLGPEKDTCRQDSLSKWIDWYHSPPPSVFIRQYLVLLIILVNFTGIFVKLGPKVKYGGWSPKLIWTLCHVMCTAVLIGWDPATPPSPRNWTSITRALLVSKDRRHLLVTPWLGRLLLWNFWASF